MIEPGLRAEPGSSQHMPKMNAAVVRSFDHPPRYERFDVPRVNDDQMLVDVLAVGLHPRVRSGAAGTHYTSTGSLPMIPGIDGVGRRPDGKRIYFVADDDVFGTMADKAAVDPRRAIALPDAVDEAAIAATMNPALSSWVALRRRVSIQPGQSVLVLGATGSAGSLALGIAKRLGAGHVVGAGRNMQRLSLLRTIGADDAVQLTEDPAEMNHSLAAAAAEVDIVLDYLWGQPAVAAMVALLSARTDRSRPLDWIQIGAIAGATIELPSAALRSTNLRLLGSGLGAVSPQGYLDELPALIDEISAGTIALEANVRPLAAVERIWAETDAPGERTVIAP
jgi:NADPH:quinone reductase-like Zn-dependent oxidoreductase